MKTKLREIVSKRCMYSTNANYCMNKKGLDYSAKCHYFCMCDANGLCRKYAPKEDTGNEK